MTRPAPVQLYHVTPVADAAAMPVCVSSRSTTITTMTTTTLIGGRGGPG